jgi:hypothetical protein
MVGWTTEMLCLNGHLIIAQRVHFDMGMRSVVSDPGEPFLPR